MREVLEDNLDDIIATHQSVHYGIPSSRPSIFSSFLKTRRRFQPSTATHRFGTRLRTRLRLLVESLLLSSRSQLMAIDRNV